ncbi:MAG: protein kinase [Ignavibacteriales bacterium]|nr:protein kinase [Ignavibacteriales bacterium]
MIGQTISHYKILEKLGEGGMGAVYKAEDTKLRRSVALKFLTPEMTRDKEAKSRFIQEAQAASALDHPNIAVVHEIDDTDDGRSFICMAYYDGKTLKDQIEEGPFGIDKAIRVSIQIADGLQRAHEAGIVHRDIKPANIILTERGDVKIVDFGVAKLSSQTRGSSTTTGGTAAYMSPEQAQGINVDARSDLFSLGVVMYEMVTGKRPFVAEHEAALMYSIVNIEPSPLSAVRQDISKEVEAVILKLLEKDPSKRYQTASEVRSQLRHLIGFTESTRKFLLQPNIIVDRKLVISAAILVILAAIIAFPKTRNMAERLLGLGAIPAEKYVAVLPFSAVGGDSASQAFCDGLMETLTSKLTQLQKPKTAYWVVAASEIRQRKVSSPTDAGKSFGVTLAVTGSVQRRDHQVRVTINLVEAATGKQLESAIIDKYLTSLADLQDEAALTVAEMFGLEIQPQDLQVLSAGKTLASQAYHFYLQGRGYLQNYQKVSNIDLAVQMFQNALKEDSMYALAYAGLGEAYWRKFEATKDKQWVTPAVHSVDKAIRLNDQLAPIHFTMGLVQKGTGDYDGAVIEFQRTIELDSLNGDAYRELADTYVRQQSLFFAEATFKKSIGMKPSYWAGYSDLGGFYYRQKRYDEAIQQFQRVAELTPDNARVYSALGGTYFAAGKPAEAVEFLEKSVSMEPTHAGFSNLATLYFFDRSYANAIRSYEKALALNDKDYRVWGNLASCYFWSGQRAQAMRNFERAVEKAEELRKVNPRDAVVLSHLADYYSMLGKMTQALSLIGQSLKLAPEAVDIIRRSADVYEQIGQRDQAFRQLELALRKGTTLQELERAPALKELRSDPRYKSLVERQGKKP